MLWEQFIGPSLKAMRTLLMRPLQSYGNTASLSYPDTWVRKPDCLHLPYKFLIRYTICKYFLLFFELSDHFCTVLQESSLVMSVANK